MCLLCTENPESLMCTFHLRYRTKHSFSLTVSFDKKDGFCTNKVQEQKTLPKSDHWFQSYEQLKDSQNTRKQKEIHSFFWLHLTINAPDIRLTPLDRNTYVKLYHKSLVKSTLLHFGCLHI